MWLSTLQCRMFTVIVVFKIRTYNVELSDTTTLNYWIFVARLHSNADARYCDTDIGILSSRLSVRLSRSDIVSKYHHPQHVIIASIILVFSWLNIFAKFQRGHPLRGVRYRCDIYISLFWPILGSFTTWETIQNRSIVILWNGSRESDALYRNVTFPMTLSGLSRSFQYCCFINAQLTCSLLAMAKLLV